jgi:hypothetical protein
MPCWCKRLRGGWEQKDREGMAPATAGAAIGWEGDEQVLESDGDADTPPTARRPSWHRPVRMPLPLGAFADDGWLE